MNGDFGPRGEEYSESEVREMYLRAWVSVASVLFLVFAALVSVRWLSW